MALAPGPALARASRPVTTSAGMSHNTDRQFQAADAAVAKAVDDFMNKIERVSGKWEAVASQYVIERLLLELCTELTKLIDDPIFRNHAGPATVKLSNALADYRDSRAEER